MSVYRTRAQAWFAKARTYYTGPLPCGHDAERYTHSTECVACVPILKGPRPKDITVPFEMDDWIEYIKLTGGVKPAIPPNAKLKLIQPK